MFSDVSEEEGDEGSEETRDREVRPQCALPTSEAVPNLCRRLVRPEVRLYIAPSALGASFSLLLQVTPRTRTKLDLLL